MLGLFETSGVPWNVDEIPNDFTFGEIEPDWDSTLLQFIILCLFFIFILSNLILFLTPRHRNGHLYRGCYVKSS
jgi:hypothetical protein